MKSIGALPYKFHQLKVTAEIIVKQNFEYFEIKRLIKYHCL